MFDSLSPNMKAAIFTATITLMLAALGGAYTYGYNAGARDIEAVNDFKKLNLPSLIQALGVLSRDVHERASIVAENQRLGKELADDKAQLQRLSSELSGRQRKAAALQTQVDEMKVTLSRAIPAQTISVEVNEHDTAKVIPNLLTISNQDTSVSSVRFNINGTTSYMSVGDHKNIQLGPDDCDIQLLKIAGLKAGVDVSCSPTLQTTK